MPQRQPNGHHRQAITPPPAVSEPPVQDVAAEAAAWKDKYTRLVAQRENDRKRMEKQIAHQEAQQREQLLRDMLPLADNLARAIAHDSADPSGLKEGVTLTMKAFTAALAKHGVFPIEAEGKPFDPNWHEAVGAVPHPTLPAGTVLRVEEAGYRLGERLLRPARVLVVAG